MARNKIDLMKAFFGRLINYAELDDVFISSPDQARWISKKDQADLDLMIAADVKSLVLTRQIRAVSIRHEEQQTYAFFGLDDPTAVPPGLQVIEPTPALVSLSVVEAEVLPTASGTLIRDRLENQHAGNGDGYAGHDLSDVLDLYPRVLCFAAETDYDYVRSTDRTLGSLLSRSYLDGPIVFEDETVDALAATFEDGSSYIPYQNLLQAILAISWPSCYLELYRTLEQLFAAPRVADLREAWPATKSIWELAQILERTLGWWPREEEALGKVLSQCSPPALTALNAALGRTENLEDAVGCARRVYDLRNCIAHFRPAHEQVFKEPSEWNEIIRAMLGAILTAYDHFGVQFFEDVAEEVVKAA